MKLPRLTLGLAFILLPSAFILLPSAFILAQGPLTPPGAPAPTMKTLAQIEPRTPISSAPFTIGTGGSYYLAANLTVTTGDAITVAADNVTLDLNGFTISSTAPSAVGTGILLSGGRRRVRILNGFIVGGVVNNAGVYAGSGFANGITFSGSTPRDAHVRDVSVAGCLLDGINLEALGNSTTVVESCTVRTVGGTGILAERISSSSALGCGGTGISAFVARDCHGSSTGSGIGVVADSAENCYGISYGGSGLSARNASNCSGESTSGSGVEAVNAQNCSGSSGNGKGISADAAVSCYGSASGIGTGILANTATACSGFGFLDYGLIARSAQNCWGSSQGGTGIVADVADGCYAVGVTGIRAYSAVSNSYGESSGNGVGIVTSVASNCQGTSYGSGFGLAAEVSTNCSGYSATGVGLRFSIMGAMCFGQRGSPVASNYVLGVGLYGAYNLP